MIERFRNLQIYPKLIMAFLLVITPIYILGFVMNARASERVKSEITTSIENQVGFFLRSFQSEINRILTFKTAFVTDEDFERLSSWFQEMDDYTKARSIIAVQNKLSMFERTSPYIGDVGVYIPAIARTLYADDYRKSLSEEELAFLKQHPSLEGSPIANLNNELIVNQVYPQFLNEATPISFALKIDLSEEEIVRSLNSITGQGGAIILSADFTWTISDPSNTYFAAPLRSYLRQLGPPSAGSGRTELMALDTNYWVSYEYSPFLNAYMAVFIPEQVVAGPLVEYERWMWGLSILSVLVVIVFSLGIHRMVHRPVRSLVLAFRKVEKGDFDVELHEESQFEFRYLYRQFNTTIQRLSVLIQENFVQRLRMQNSELKQLQAQINPHFLYNCFLTLHFLARNHNVEHVIKMTSHLGGYYRFITRSASDEVTLELEMNHLKDYAAIQSIRFENRIDLNIGDLPESCKNIMVPRLILQPLLENAYEHALEAKTADGVIEISFEADDNRLTIRLDDNGEQLLDTKLDELEEKLGKPPLEAMETTGMINVHRRLQLKFGADCGLTVRRSPLGGLRLSLSIPMREKEEAACTT